MDTQDSNYAAVEEFKLALNNAYKHDDSTLGDAVLILHVQRSEKGHRMQVHVAGTAEALPVALCILAEKGDDIFNVIQEGAALAANRKAAGDLAEHITTTVSKLFNDPNINPNEVH